MHFGMRVAHVRMYQPMVISVDWCFFVQKFNSFEVVLEIGFAGLLLSLF